MEPLELFSEATRAWFRRAFAAPTPAQELGWPAIASGEHALIQAPTGSGKTLAAFLYGIDRLKDSPGRYRGAEEDVGSTAVPGPGRATSCALFWPARAAERIGEQL
ncbi:MAG: DEAD/DEAH box helicase [Gaiellaceae bacterium]